MGLAVGVVVLAVVLSAVFILPKAVSEFYYNPNEAAGQYEEMTTTRNETWICLSILSCFCQVITVIRSVQYQGATVNTISSFHRPPAGRENLLLSVAAW